MWWVGFLCASLASSVAPAAELGGAETTEHGTPELVVRRGVAFSFDKEITVPATQLAARQIDVLFLSDNTGSMTPVINRVRQTAQYLFGVLANIDGRFEGRDFAYGVARYVGDPSEGVSRDTAFVLQQPITKDEDIVSKAINDWFARGGGDEPESNFFALHQIATGGSDMSVETADRKSQDTRRQGESEPTANASPTGEARNIGWRPGARRIVLWFGDAPGHPLAAAESPGTVQLAEARQALASASITLAAMNTRPEGQGIDAEKQASLLIRGTGGLLVHNLTARSLVNDVLNILDDLTAPNPFTLFFMETPDGISLDLRCEKDAPCPEANPGDKVTVTFSGVASRSGDHQIDFGLAGFNGIATSLHLKVID